MIQLNKLPRPSTDRLRTLLDEGANPNILHRGYTALHLAAIKGYMEWVQILLQYGADMKIRTGQDAHTVLHLATLKMRQGYLLLGSKIIEFLLDQGADPNLPNVVGHTLLHELVRVAAYQKTAPYAWQLIRWQVRSLMKRGVCTELKNLEGHTPLSYAIIKRHKRMAALLLENGSRPDTLDYKGRTPLHLAVASDKVSTEFVRRLIKAGASVNQEDMQKHTPLFVAARNKVRDEVIGLLLDSGADCEFEDAAVMRRIRRVKFWRKLKEGPLKVWVKAAR
jgi:ankyrin repeat protein